MKTKVIITLEFDDQPTTKDVEKYLLELIESEILDFKIIGTKDQ